MAPTAGTRLRYKNARSKKPQQAKKLPSLKNRIRGIERFLSRGGLNDATRREKKAELEQLREEQAIKDKLAVEKKNAEKYKKSRFFERVKVMRKLRQAKHGIEQVKSPKKASDDAERVEYEKKFKAYQEEMMYIYYYPKSEPYLSLFPSAPHSMANQNRQNELRAEAVSRFAREQPVDAFNQFCLNGGKSKELRSSSGTRSAIELLLKKPTKEQVKKQKKMRNKRDKLGDKSKHTPVLVDQDDDDDVLNLSETSDTKVVVQEEDDFFL